MESRGYRELSLPTTTPLPTGLLVELGLQRREEISRLRQADGPLTRQIEAVVTSWCEQLKTNPDAEVVPVVLLYRLAEPDYVVIAAHT
jgi:hypothetical protein